MSRDLVGINARPDSPAEQVEQCRGIAIGVPVGAGHRRLNCLKCFGGVVLCFLAGSLLLVLLQQARELIAFSVIVGKRQLAHR
jgi:hypothetical protein